MSLVGNKNFQTLPNLKRFIPVRHESNCSQTASLKVWALEWSTGTAHQNLEQDSLPEVKVFSHRSLTVKCLIATENNKVFKVKWDQKSNC